MLADDLDWLRDNAFTTLVSFNDHRAGFRSVAEQVENGDIQDDNWIDGAAKAAAIEGNVLVEVQVYPCGSVGSYLLLGIELEPLVARMREICSAELDHWQQLGHVPMHKR